MRKRPREVRNVILMLGSSIFVAFLAVVILVYYLGSSGTYLLRNILISPETLQRTSFVHYDPKTSKEARFIFNKIEFVRAQSQGRQWGRYAVSRASYAEFYKKVANERSLPLLTDERVQQFDLIVPSTLTIFVRGRDNFNTSGDGILFQQVQFLDQDDLFRVELPPGRYGKDQWVYFRHPGIYKIVVQLFAPTLQMQ